MRNKIVALLLVVLMALEVGSALAVQISFTQAPVPAANTTTVLITDYPYYGLKSSKPGYLYVRHYLWSSTPGYYGSSNYTNFFQAVPSTNPSARYGGNWMAPGTADYIRSANITTGNSYGVAVRANTKYSDAGFSTIQISGYMDSNN